MIGIRVDANKSIASGHVMRCLTIAEEIRALGEQCVFLVANDTHSEAISKKGFEVIVLPCSGDEWDESIGAVIEVIQYMQLSLLLVDSYLVTSKFLEEINRIIPTVYYDDEFKEKYDVSAIIAPTQSRDTSFLYDWYRDTSTKLMVGKKYLIFREEFRDINRENVDKKNILITTGGTDPYQFSLLLARKISEKMSRDIDKLTVVLGAMNNDEAELRGIDSDKLIVLKNISNIGEIMQDSLIAVSAYGNTMYELMACKVPTIGIAFSEDQVRLAKKMEEDKIVFYAGDLREQNVVDIVVEQISFMLNDKDRRDELKLRMEGFCDGFGACRVAEEIINIVRIK